METEPKPLAKQFKLALIWTLAWIVASFPLADLLNIHYRIFGVSLFIGWLPIVVVAMRRPLRPTKLDLFALFAGHPVIFLALAAFSRWYFHKH